MPQVLPLYLAADRVGEPAGRKEELVESSNRAAPAHDPRARAIRDSCELQ